jgi:flavin-dependent dehydrogenase
MDVPATCDVVVAGGGPAGSTAATLLSQRGYDVVLLEKERHPRYNVGESLIPHFWKYCELMGADGAVESDGFVQKAGGTVIWNGVIRQMRFRDFGYARPALHVERDRFDLILLDHARAQGSNVVEEVAVTGAKLGAEGGPVVSYRGAGGVSGQVRCRFLVDASGQGAVLARQLGSRVVDDAFKFMSVWGYFEDSLYVGADGSAHPFSSLRSIPPTTFVSNIDGWSWLWHIPQRDSTSVGLVLTKEEMQGVKGGRGGLEADFLRRCGAIPYLSRLLEGATYVEGSFHAIRDYSYRPAQLTGPGFFLIGDAAAFIDPIFSIGIVLGMYSGYLAAWAIDRSLGDPSKTASSQAIFARQFGSRLEASRALALPRYGFGATEAALVSSSLGFETALEQELMYVVSTLSTRSDNFVEMFRERPDAPTDSDRYRVLEEIVF